MSTYEEAFAAKEKFKEDFWKKSPEKYNVVSIGIDVIYTITGDEITDEVETYFVKAFLFDYNDVATLELPKSIDNVEIRYIQVIPLMDEKL